MPAHWLGDESLLSDAAGNIQRVIAGDVTMYPEAMFRARYANETHWRPPAFA